MTNPDLARLQPYPFARLAKLLANSQAPALAPIALSIGEPKHDAPQLAIDALVNHVAGMNLYPSTKGLPELRQTIAAWANQRFDLAGCELDPEKHILPVNGTREALFAFAQVVVDRSQKPLVVSPNPFYQIYEGAAFLAGAEPYFLPCTADNDFLPDYAAVPAEVWQRCQLLYVCSPGNPTGAVTDLQTWQQLIELAEEHDFIIAADECYSELYFDESAPPPGLLSACAALGRHDFRRCVVFHSLSKRSNLPGLRSGFVAGDAEVMEAFFQFRTYHGCAMPVHHQLVSIAAWQDEQHVTENRALYREKFDSVLRLLTPHLDVTRPDAGFYLWPRTPVSDTEFCRQLFEQQHVTVLPGTFLARTVDGKNPGADRVRMALVAPPAACTEAAERIRAFLTR